MQRAEVLASIFLSTSEVTYFSVQNQAAAGVQNVPFSWHTATTNRFQTHFSWSNNFICDFPQTAAGRLTIPQSANWDDVYHIAEYYRIPGYAEIKVDGAFIGSGTSTGTLTNTLAAAINIGNQVAAACPKFLGEIAEIIIYNRALSTTERKDVREYLSLKYAIGI